MKNLKITALMIAALFAFSCSSEDDDEGESAETLLNTPVAGTAYGEDFEVNANGGYASNISSNGVESVWIYLSSEALGCNAPDGTEFPVTILAPRSVGTHTANVLVSFKDPNSGDFVSNSTLTVEIISIGDTVVGKVMAESLTEDNDINGKFEVPYCL